MLCKRLCAGSYNLTTFQKLTCHKRVKEFTKTTKFFSVYEGGGGRGKTDRQKDRKLFPIANFVYKNKSSTHQHHHSGSGRSGDDEGFSPLRQKQIQDNLSMF